MDRESARCKASGSTGQHNTERTNIHTLSGIRTHDPSIQAVKTHALDTAATVIDNNNSLQLFVYSSVLHEQSNGQ
jgi:hypothetical protein